MAPRNGPGAAVDANLLAELIMASTRDLLMPNTLRYFSAILRQITPIRSFITM
jgi:hypothetical protein